jgi:aminoglycoside phosphotransferase (APT) family kinase protein
MTTNHPPLDQQALEAWMDRQSLPAGGAPVEHKLIAGGSQNEIFEISRGNFRCALRKPPLSAPASRDDGIRREWRILAALAASDVPHPAAVALCDDASVLGRPFYLMSLVDGWSPIGQGGLPSPFDSDPKAQQALAYQIVDGVIRMGAFD